MKPTFTKPNAYRYIGLATLILLAVFLRWPAADGKSTYLILELWRDLGVLERLADGQMAYFGPPTVHGGFRFGPAYYYLSFPLAWLTHFKPYSLAVTSLALSVGSLVLTWQLARRWFAERPMIAWQAAFLLCLSVLDVQFAKYGSNPNGLAFFGLVLLLAIEPFSRGKGRWTHAAIAGIAFGIGLQLHLVAALSMSVFLLAALLTRLIRPTWSAAIAFLLTVLLVNGPYLLGIWMTGFRDIIGLGQLAGAAPLYGSLATRLRDLASFWISLGFSEHHMFSLVHLIGWTPLAVLYGNIILLVGIYLLDKPTRRLAGPACTPTVSLLLLWLASINLVLIFPWGSVSQLFIYYFVLAIPACYVLIAIGISRLWYAGRRTTVFALLLSYLSWQAYQLVIYHQLYPSAWISLITGR